MTPRCGVPLFQAFPGPPAVWRVPRLWALPTLRLGQRNAKRNGATEVDRRSGSYQHNKGKNHQKSIDKRGLKQIKVEV